MALVMSLPADQGRVETVLFRRDHIRPILAQHIGCGVADIVNFSNQKGRAFYFCPCRRGLQILGKIAQIGKADIAAGTFERMGRPLQFGILACTMVVAHFLNQLGRGKQIGIDNCLGNIWAE